MFRRAVVLAVLCAVSLPVVSAAASGSSCTKPGGACNGEVPFTIHQGGSGPFAGRHADLCKEHKIEPGSSARAKVAVTLSDGDLTWRVYSHVTEGRAGKDGVLVCAPMLEIWGHTTGPGSDGVSVDCAKHGMVPLENGAGYSVSPHAHVTQSHGGYGHHKDGYWHYKFHNWTAQTVSIQFWAVCTNR